MKNKSQFSSRVGVRSVVSAMMVSTSLMLLLLGLIAAMGLWNFRITEIPTENSNFWVACSTAWAISMFVCGYMASSGTRSQSVTDGIFNALTACSGIFLLFAIYMLGFARESFLSILENASIQFYWQAFVGDVIAFGFGIVGGMAGVRYEQREPDYFRKKILVG